MTRLSAPAYDRFKLIVTIILAVILLLMLLRGCAANVAPASPTAIVDSPVTTEAVTSPPRLTETVPPASDTETATSLPVSPTAAATLTQTAVEPTATSASADTTPTASPTVSPDSATSAVTPTAAPESTLEPTVTAAVSETPASGEVASCNTASPSRLAVGQQASVLQRLNVRSDASITASILKVNPTGTQVEVIGGPVCTPVGESAYLWWQIRLSDGTEGWSAETPLNQSGYFLEPSS